MTSFALTKDESATLSRLIDDIASSKAKIEQTITIYNQQVEVLRSPVESAVTELNNHLAEARTLCSSVAARAQAKIDDKTEKWEESDEGEAATVWQSSWDGIELDDLDFQWPDELMIDIPSYDEDLEDLPKEA
jgi:hypothetical protein